MTPRERVLCALARREPDRVPITEFLYSRPLYREVLGYAPPYYRAEEILRCSRALGYDMASVPLGGSGTFTEGTGGDTYRDEWGTLYQRSDSSWPGDAPVGFTVQTPEDLRNFRRPDPALPERIKEIREGIRLGREYGMALAGCVQGPFSAAWLMIGYENFCMKLYDMPDFIDEVLALCAGFNIEGGRRMIAEGADAIVIADDYGSCGAPFLSPGMFRRHVFPHLRRMAGLFAGMGVPVILHSDGNIRPLLDDFAGMAISALHPLERAAGLSLGQVRRAFGNRFALIGNVDNKRTLVTGTAHDVRAEARECIDAAALGGGYILASDHSVHGDVPNQNVFALADEGKKYGDYHEIRARAATRLKESGGIQK